MKPAGAKIGIVGIGAGGHARVLLDILRKLPEFEVVGLTENLRELWEEKIDGVPVLGGDDQLEKLRRSGVQAAFVGVGSVGDPAIRVRLFELARDVGFEFPCIVHPRACVSDRAVLGGGVQVMAEAVVNPGADVGANTILNTGAIVEHDTKIGGHSHIAPRCVIGGGAKIGSRCHLGIGAVIREGLEVGDGALVGAGAVVVRDVAPGDVVFGVPAKPKRIS